MNRPYLEGRFRITPVSPIAVCSGDRIPPMEIRQAGNQVHILDLRAYLADPQVPMAQRLKAVRPDGTADIPPEKYSRYSLPLLWNPAGQPGPGQARPAGRPGQYGSFGSYAAARGTAAVAAAAPHGITEILQAIKDSQDRPYLPGSSLKGAIRTALAVALWNSVDEETRNAAIGEGVDRRKSQFAARFLEAALFGGGRNAVLDSLKLLVVRDSPALPSDRLCLAELWVMTPNPQGQLEPKRRPTDFRNYLEVIVPAESFWWEQPFLLRSYDAKTDRDYELRRAALQLLANPGRILDSIRSFGQKLLAQELTFYKTHGPKPLAEFIQSLATRSATEAFLPVGFGTGWRTKTVFLCLQPEGIEGIRKEFRLDRERSGPRFPKTRKILFRNGEPWRPLGWLKIELAP